MTAHYISTAILVIHWCIIIGLSSRVIYRSPSVGVSLAWLAVICSVPFLGAATYLFFGEKRLGKARKESLARNNASIEAWKKELNSKYHDRLPSLDSQVIPLVTHAQAQLGLSVLPSNQLELICDYAKFFDRLLSDINGATKYIHICFYIWNNGGRADEIFDALAAASRRGVICLALADAVGSKQFLRSRAFKNLRSAGVQIQEALPTGFFHTLVARSDLRNHRKIVVIDGKIGYSGSQNLVDPRFFKKESGVGLWIDAMVRASGPVVCSLDGVFLSDWAVEASTVFSPPVFDENPEESPTGTQLIQTVPSGPDVQADAIHQLLLSSIYLAQRELVMTTPYFVPDESMITALISASLRGVKVSLIIPAKNNSFFVRYASASHYQDLLLAGVNIAQFKGGLLHTKSLTVDDSICVFGSVNLDMRSLWLNFEISLFVYDTQFTKQVKLLQEHYLDDSSMLDIDEWRERPRWRHLLENCCKLLSPLL